MKKYFILSLFLFTGIGLYADHIVGSDITYRCTNNDSIYKVIFNFYRDCNGCYVLGQSPRCGTSENCASSATAPTVLTVSCLKNNSNLGTFSLTRTSIVDITQTCSKSPSRCQQPCNGSYPYGIEKHTFEGTLDLRNYMKNGCCEFRVSVTLSVRSAIITTGQAVNQFYTFAEINACNGCNNSPDLTNDPVAILCCDQPYVFNNGAVDNKDADSISYSLAPAFRGANNQASYGSGYSPEEPLKVYYRVNRKYPYTAPNDDPPQGFFLDPETGDIILTPTKCGEIAIIVMQMTEWRKDSTGKYYKIGVTRRDMQFIVDKCPDNNPPRITNTTFKYAICAGEKICFDITTDDKVYVPPPPLPTPDPDTVQLTWNRGIPGASFTIKNPTDRLKTGEFCWQTKIGDARDLPWTFTATVRDNACPKNASATRAFNITVKKKAEAKRDIDTLKCGNYAIRSIKADNFTQQATYNWRLLDDQQRVITNPKTARFLSNGFYVSDKEMDTIKFGKGGMYIIEHIINNPPLNCPTTYLDTLIVPNQLEVDIAFGKDTFVCAGQTVRLQPRTAYGRDPLKFKWYRPIVHVPGDTLTYLDIVPFTKDTSYFVEVTDANGCVEGDSVRVFLKENPRITLPPDKQICPYNDYLVLANLDTAYWLNPDDSTFLRQGDTLRKEWTFNGLLYGSNDSIRVNLEGEYILRVTDSLGCFDVDTFKLLVNDWIRPNAGMDQTLCWDDLMVLVGQGLDTVGPGRTGTYRWWDYTTNPGNRVLKGSRDTLSFKIRTTTSFQMEIAQTEDTLTCFAYDSVTVNVNPLPVLTMPANQKVCCDAGVITLQVSARAEPNGGTWSCRQNPALVVGNQFYTDAACDPNNTSIYTLIYTYTNPATGCINKDSIRMTVAPLPRVELKPYVYACQDAVIVDLDDYVNRPLNQSLGTPQWKCLDCGPYTTAQLIFNAGTTFLPDFRMRVGESFYTLRNPEADTLLLEYTFRNGDGCTNKDTIPVYIVKVPKISFNGPNPVCEDYGMLSLDQQTGVFPLGGNWRCRDTSGFDACSNVVWGNGDTMNVNYGNTKPGFYYLRYDLGGACPVSRDTTIRIHPLPVVRVNPSTYVNGGLTIRTDRQICETDGNVNLNATPPGGVWTADPTASGMIAGTRFNTDNAPRNQLIKLVYSFTNPSTGCINKDSTDITVQPMPVVDILTPEIDTCRTNNMSIEYRADFANTAGITWFVTPANGVSIPDNRANPTTINFSVTNDSSSQFIIIAQTDAGDACPATSAVKILRIHPVPDAQIVPDKLNGCEPLDVNFDVTVNNNVNTTNATYTWDFGDGNNGTGMPVSHQFTTPGTSNVAVQVTSEHGCDTILRVPIDIYPLPTAAFTPTPRSTTSALPRFSFNNESTVNPVLGSVITLNEWDFGDPLNTLDTSTRRNPVWYYGADTATYQVTLRVTTNYGCTDEFTDWVQIGPDILVYIPNAFSPDGSGPVKNDRFRVVASGYKTFEITIFNRWGEVLYTSSNLEEGWDGNYMAQPCQQDVYAYLVRFTNFKDEEYVYDGTITLIR